MVIVQASRAEAGGLSGSHGTVVTEGTPGGLGGAAFYYYCHLTMVVLKIYRYLDKLDMTTVISRQA
jgi:hypothetical protein